MSRNIVSDEDALWYSPLVSSMSNSDDEDNNANLFKEDIGTQEECLISFWLSGPQEEPSQNKQPTSENKLVVMSPKRRLTCHDKGK